MLSIRSDLIKLRQKRPDLSAKITHLCDRIPPQAFRPSHCNISHLPNRDSLRHLHLYLDNEKDYAVYYHLVAKHPNLSQLSFNIRSLICGSIFNFAASLHAMNPSLPKEISRSIKTVHIYCYIDKRMPYNLQDIFVNGLYLFPNLERVIVVDQSKDSGNRINVLQRSLLNLC